MQIGYTQLAPAIEKQLLPLYLLHGDELLLQQEAWQTITQYARTQNFTERTCFTATGAHFNWSEILASSHSRGLFSDKSILDIRIPNGKPGKEGGAALIELAHILQRNTDIICIISLPKLDKTSKGSTWFTALEKIGVSIMIPTIERKDLAQWVVTRLKTKDLQLAQSDAGRQGLRFLCEAVEGNLLAAHQEIEKLALLYPNPPESHHLDINHISKAVTDVARFHAFQLTSSILSGNAAYTQRILDALEASGESPILAHYVISEDVRNLYRIRTAMDKGMALPLAMQSVRAWGEKQQLYERCATHSNSKQWLKLLHLSQRTDGIIKGLPQDDLPRIPWHAMHHLAQSVCAVVG